MANIPEHDSKQERESDDGIRSCKVDNQESHKAFNLTPVFQLLQSLYFKNYKPLHRDGSTYLSI